MVSKVSKRRSRERITRAKTKLPCQIEEEKRMSTFKQLSFEEYGESESMENCKFAQRNHESINKIAIYIVIHYS